ncbi:phosphate acetyltransferase [Eubacteriales bacterium OttesenSCG-928-N14]|nr:phosphate acetyltransferase [Eubacteriales bacterium OttesenSCG-928-N14]
MKLVDLLTGYDNRTIVFPEGDQENIILAAYQARQLAVCKPLFVATEQAVQAVCNHRGIEPHGWYDCILPPEEPTAEDIALLTQTGMDEMVANFLLQQPLYYAAMLLKKGVADAMVAGYVHESGEVISAANMIVGLQPDIGAPSSYFLFEIPGFLGSEGNMLVYADCGLQIEPNAQQLADIAILTARSIKKLLRWEPRVALLSFSTKGSSEHAKTQKIIDALAIVRQKQPDLLIDGEMQADAALNEDVAIKKMPEGSQVAGKANILIFPDLDAGNIAYKLTQRLTGGTAYGPILQGFAKPVCDLSRGSSVEDILGVIAIAAVM